MAPPLRLHIEARASTEDVENYVSRLLAKEFSGGDTGDDDDSMYLGDMPALRVLQQEFGPDFWTSLPAKVSRAADGIFLHAQLFMDRLKLQRSIDGARVLTNELMEGKLDTIAGQWSDMLSLCLEKASRYTAMVARDFISLVAASVDVLTFDQLSHAVAISYGDKNSADFTGRCISKDFVRRNTNSLLSISNSGKATSFPVGFCHRSLSTYIHDHRTKWFPDAHQRMFDACISYLLLEALSKPFGSVSDMGQALEEYPFASYAACYWGLHAREVSMTVGNGLRILGLVSDEDRLACVMQVAWHTHSSEASMWDVGGGIMALHACAFYGLEPMCRALLESGCDVDACDRILDQTPMSYACRRGHTNVVELLLQYGADPNHTGTLGKSPLLEAIENGHERVLELLLGQQQLNVNARCPGRAASTALVTAAELGNLSMLDELLGHKDVDVNRTDGMGCTALARAVEKRRMRSVERLLKDERTDLTATDNISQRTALDWTAEHSLPYEEACDELCAIAKMLLDDRQEPKVSDQAVTNAIGGRKTQLLKVFAGAEWNLDFTDAYGRSFLHLAAAEGDCGIVDIIYCALRSDPSFSIDKRDMYGATALHLACREVDEARVATIRYLISVHAKVSLGDNEGRTPYHLAKSASPEL